MQRLKTRPQFQAALAGQRVASTTHFVLHRCSLAATASRTASMDADASPASLFSPADAVWLGAMVPKRWARRAATRNAIRRQVYAAGARFEARLPQAAHVVRLRSAFDRKSYVSACSDALKQAVRQELEQLLARGAAAVRKPVQGAEG